MEYRKDKYGNDISALGYGCMRFTQSSGKIDLEKAEKEILEAVRSGVNYFDTAYIYPGSEAALGEILERNQIRDKVYIATKLPHYMVRKGEQLDKYFEEELRRLRTDHVDFYLCHMMNDITAFERMKSLGLLEWIEGKKKSGAIRQIGFSYHGNSDMFCQLLDAYDWDFCQIQYNYLDENSQAGRTGLHHAASKGIPVVIMEPLRGGKLVNNLPKEAVELFESHTPKRSPAEWAFRWLWNQPEVTCVLSGMNSMEMVQENVRVASETRVGEFTAEDQELLQKVVAILNSKVLVGCTGCRYCMPCPRNVDIPGTFAVYNKIPMDGKSAAKSEYLICTGLRKNYTGPANCIQCGKCEQHCPQQIHIREELKNAEKALEGPVQKAMRKVITTFAKF